MLNRTKTQCRKALLMTSIMALSSVNAFAASIETSSEAKTVGGWSLDVSAGTDIVTRVNGLNDSAARDWDFGPSRTFMEVKVQNADGSVQLVGRFNLDSLTTRSLNGNEAGDKGVPMDNSGALKHIIDELTLKYSFSEMIALKAGIGSVDFGAPREDRGDRAVVSSNSLQNGSSLIDQRLMAELSLNLDKYGTKMVVTVFDGRNQNAIDPNGKFAATDFVDINLDTQELQDSASFAATLKQKLGDTGLNAILSYARIRKVGGADAQSRIAAAIQYATQIQDWSLSALYQYVRVMDTIDLDSHLVEFRASRKELHLYARVEMTQENVAGNAEWAKGVTAGVAYDIYKGAHMTLTPFAEISAYKRDGADADLQGRIGVRASGGTRRPSEGGKTE